MVFSRLQVLGVEVEEVEDSDSLRSVEDARSRGSRARALNKTRFDWLVPSSF